MSGKGLMNKRISLGAVFGVILVLVFFYFTIVRGISELSAKPAEPNAAKQGNVVEYNVVYAKEVYELRHMLFGIIPTYSEHYYITLDGDDLNPLAVKADKKWFEDNFSVDGFADAPVSISGLIKDADDKKGLYLNEVNAQLGDAGHINSGEYVDANYVSEAVMKIASGVLLATAVTTCLLAVVLVVKGTLKRGGIGINTMVIAAVLQIIAFIIMMIMI